VPSDGAFRSRRWAQDLVDLVLLVNANAYISRTGDVDTDQFPLYCLATPTLKASMGAARKAS